MTYKRKEKHADYSDCHWYLLYENGEEKLRLAYQKSRHQITPLLANQSREDLEELQLKGDVGDNDGGEAREGKHED